MLKFINRVKNSELVAIFTGEDWPRVTREESRQLRYGKADKRDEAPHHPELQDVKEVAETVAVRK